MCLCQSRLFTKNYKVNLSSPPALGTYNSGNIYKYIVNKI